MTASPLTQSPFGLQVRTTALASESTVAQMARLVEQAAAAQSPTETLVQRFARVYTPLVLAATACVAFVPFAAGRPDHKVTLRPCLLAGLTQMSRSLVGSALHAAASGTLPACSSPG